jgi:hypothetical protein
MIVENWISRCLADPVEMNGEMRKLERNGYAIISFAVSDGAAYIMYSTGPGRARLLDEDGRPIRTEDRR